MKSKLLSFITFSLQGLQRLKGSFLRILKNLQLILILLIMKEITKLKERKIQNRSVYVSQTYEIYSVMLSEGNSLKIWALFERL